MNKIFSIMSAIALIFSNGCTVQVNPNPTPTSTLPIVQPRANTITDTINVEGEKQKITLNLYKRAGLPFTTYVPANRFVDQTVSSGEGTAVWFYWLQPDCKPNKNVYVQFFFPGEKLTLQQTTERLLGNNGLFAINKWQVTNRSQAQEDLYPWATEKIVFRQQGDRNIVGSVFVGEYNGRAFWAVQHYPAEFGDGFEPLARKIFSYLQLI
ncbi:hypothetical protein QUB80_07005 [Chlorogloeopsis sp. ULAP01]|uniref:hypothetical protein n=1 Tax=Chlorogloeopsis sp. ULAP01 TaxID=3056483 RepID=UPI0025AAD552|nr:hypothetical protein [Chlorogloeopsis sp. ULAP01]MDM9380450.1 hypothetical protein [Chlorogloeopsis sp. ULAP01]